MSSDKTDDEVRAPNVLFVMTDQHRADHVGFGGNDVVRTPVLDDLASRGTVFENAWVSNPVCMPNRCTLVTGRLPSAHGVFANGQSLDWGSNTYVRSLREAGYRTALIGKSHLQDPGMAFGGGKAKAPPLAAAWPHGWDLWEVGDRYVDGIPELGDDFYGFDTVQFALDHGARVSGHHLQWALDRGGVFEELHVPQTQEAPASQRSDEWWQIYKPVYGEEFHSTSFVADRTSAFIEEANGEGRPWLAVASFPDPHHPMTPPGEWFHRHDPDDIELPASFDDSLADAPDFLKRIQKMNVGDMRFWAALTGATNDRVVRESIAATYGAIEMVDDRIGQILRMVERLGELDNTIVIFTSDHGDLMGDHGLLLKGLMHYRGAAQVPLLIALPGQVSTRTKALAGSIDLAPTILDLCGVEGYGGMQGTSLQPVLRDPTEKVRDVVLIEDDVPEQAAEMMQVPFRTRTVISDHHRYSRYSTGEEQLFDLSADPMELNDISESPQRTTMVERLTDALMVAAGGDAIVG